MILKGFIIGIAKIIPGVSGAVLAISMGVYEHAIEAISSFFKNPLKSIKYLIPLGIGLVISVVLGSRVITYLLANYYVITLFMFIGLMVGGIKELLGKIKFSRLKFYHYLLLIISFSSVFLLSLVGKQGFMVDKSFIVYLLIGFVDALTMVIPGISGTAIMMLLGCYHILLDLLSFNNISNNFLYLLSYGSSLIVSVFIIAKLMNYLFKKKELTIYSLIIGFMASSIFILMFDTIRHINSLLEVIFGIFLFIIGFIISLKFN